jgi:hypothetical protein
MAASRESVEVVPDYPRPSAHVDSLDSGVSRSGRLRFGSAHLLLTGRHRTIVRVLDQSRGTRTQHFTRILDDSSVRCGGIACAESARIRHARRDAMQIYHGCGRIGPSIRPKRILDRLDAGLLEDSAPSRRDLAGHERRVRAIACFPGDAATTSGYSGLAVT